MISHNFQVRWFHEIFPWFHEIFSLNSRNFHLFQDIHGIWFYEQANCQKLFATISQIIDRLRKGDFTKFFTISRNFCKLFFIFLQDIMVKRKLLVVDLVPKSKLGLKTTDRLWLIYLVMLETKGKSENFIPRDRKNIFFLISEKRHQSKLRPVPQGVKNF